MGRGPGRLPSPSLPGIPPHPALPPASLSNFLCFCGGPGDHANHVLIQLYPLIHSPSPHPPLLRPSLVLAHTLH